MGIPRRLCFVRLATLSAVLLLLIASSPASILNPPFASADSWLVTSLADDGSPGTLRYAIENAESGDTIRFGDGVRGTIPLDPVEGPLFVPYGVTIEGPGADELAIDADNNHRVFVIGDMATAPEPESAEDILGLAPGQMIDADVVISGLTIENGAPGPSPVEPIGGCVLAMGSSVALIDCIVQGGGGGHGRWYRRHIRVCGT